MNRVLDAAAATLGATAALVLAAWCLCLPFVFAWALWETVTHL